MKDKKKDKARKLELVKRDLSNEVQEVLLRFARRIKAVEEAIVELKKTIHPPTQP